MTEKTTMIPDGFKALYNSWHTQYIKEDKKWARSVKNNPFIAIESHIHEDTITDLLAHILRTDESIKEKFIIFLLNKAKKNGTIESINKIYKSDYKNTEIETQYSIKVKESRLDLFIKIPNKYHIIIESKIFDAEEQQNQMKRYIEETKKEIKKGTLLAFYATSDGQGICKSAGDNDVINLPFYLDDKKEETIYSILRSNISKGNSPSYIQDFCFYLKYNFYNQQAVSFFNDFDKNKGRCWEKILDDLYKNKNYPSISKNINPYDKSEEYFTQLIKVHALNSYLLEKFKNKKYQYHSVFEGFSVKEKIPINETYCNVYFETKYYKNDFFMVITICSINEIDNYLETHLGDDIYKNFEKKRNKVNNELTYSLWLWIQDPKSLKKSKDKEYGLKFHKEQFSNLHIAGGSFDNDVIYFKNYNKYIDFIFDSCMKKIFEGLSLKNEDYLEALNIYRGIYY